MRAHWRWSLVLLAALGAGCGGFDRPGIQTERSGPRAQVAARNASEPGGLEPEPSTFHSLAVRWPIRGDANANAHVDVQYRRTGEVGWMRGLPLFRTHPESLSPDNRVAGGWLFAGSIVDLTPDSEYEVRVSLRDPDGGNIDRVATLRTRPELTEPAGMRVRHVISADKDGPGTGTAEDPFRGLSAAQAAAIPGDLFILHAGVYLQGQWSINRFGMPGRPIIYRGAGDGEVILDGGGGERLISANEIQYVWFEGLTLRNARYLFVGHRGSNTAIRRCRFVVVHAGIVAINGGYEQSRGFVISDNVFQGAALWPRTKGIEEIHGVSITGAGHVVSYNAFTGVADGIHGNRHGRLSASDIHNNDIEGCTDDAIEADYADTNVRVFRNRITNCFVGISGQPVHGGPLYVFRNAIYNVQYSPFKLHNDTAGILILHNSSVTSGIPWHIEPAGEMVSDVVTRNNVFVGGLGPALSSTARMIRCDFDRDGYAWFAGPPSFAFLLAGDFALWNGRVYASPDAAKRSGALYATHGAIALRPKDAFASGLQPPSDVRIRYPVAVNDLRLAAGSPAIDAGVTLPNFNDGFSGDAPDLGCCEVGASLPQYGPRPPAAK